MPAASEPEGTSFSYFLPVVFWGEGQPCRPITPWAPQDLCIPPPGEAQQGEVCSPLLGPPQPADVCNELFITRWPFPLKSTEMWCPQLPAFQCKAKLTCVPILAACFLHPWRSLPVSDCSFPWHRMAALRSLGVAASAVPLLAGSCIPKEICHHLLGCLEQPQSLLHFPLPPKKHLLRPASG